MDQPGYARLPLVPSLSPVLGRLSEAAVWSSTDKGLPCPLDLTVSSVFLPPPAGGSGSSGSHRGRGGRAAALVQVPQGASPQYSTEHSLTLSDFGTDPSRFGTDPKLAESASIAVLRWSCGQYRAELIRIVATLSRGTSAGRGESLLSTLAS